MPSPIRALPIALAAALAVLPGGGAGADPSEWRRVDGGALFVGRMTLNTAGDLVSRPGDLDFRDSVLIGAVYSREWRRGGAPLSYGFEVQAVAHAGEQDHLELVLPLTARWHLPGPLRQGSLAAGLGVSYATDRPEVEVARSGDSQSWLAYWHVEAEMSLGGDRPAAFVRIHHRSDAYGVFETDTGSNAVVLGLRRRW
jgi:hypothetical protein